MIDALGLPNDLLRNIAIVVLAGFGIVLLVPALSARVEGFASSFASRLGVKARRRRRLLARVRPRPQPRRPLRALRRPDPRRRPHLLRLAVLQRRPPRRRPRLRARLGDRPLRDHARRPQAVGAARPPQRRLPDGDGRDHGPRRLRDVAGLRHEVPVERRRRAARLPTNPAEGIEKSGSAQEALAEIRGGEATGSASRRRKSNPKGPVAGRAKTNGSPPRRPPDRHRQLEARRRNRGSPPKRKKRCR